MKNIRILLLSFLLLGGWIPETLLSTTVTLVNSMGESSQINVEESDRFIDVIEYIQNQVLFAESNTDSQLESDDRMVFSEIPLEFEITHAGLFFRAKKKNCHRNYECGYSKRDKEDIHRILTSLARDSLISIASQKSSIERAGDRLDPLHPLCFLMCIFCDEELKCCAHAIRDRGGWVADGFYSGIVNTLGEEEGRNNLYQFVDDFAKKVKIDPAIIRPSLQQRKWMEFTNLLIDQIPRENDPTRYNNM